MGLVHPHLNNLLSLPRGSQCEEIAHCPSRNTHVLIAEPSRRLDHLLPSSHCAAYASPLSQRHPLALGSGLAVRPTSLMCIEVPEPSWLLSFSSKGTWKLPLLTFLEIALLHQPCHPICIALSWQPKITLGHAAPGPHTSHRFTGRRLQPYRIVSLSQPVSQGSSSSVLFAQES